MFQSFLCWIIIYHFELFGESEYIDEVSILLMLDNNLSHISCHCPCCLVKRFQSFLCWIIIYHLYAIWLEAEEKVFVSILLMLDNNLSRYISVIFPYIINMFQSFLCWIIIYHKNDYIGRIRKNEVSILLMLDNNLSLSLLWYCIERFC